MKQGRLAISEQLLVSSRRCRIEYLILLSCIVVFFFPNCKTIAQTTDSTKVEQVRGEPISNTTYILEKTIPIQGRFMTVDHLENIYVISTENEIIKYSKEGEELYQFSYDQLGNATFMDATNTFNILVYYRDYQTVIILDRFLNLTAKFDFYQADALDTDAICMSNDQNVWLYDSPNAQLKKVNAVGEIFFESQTLLPLVEEGFSPTFMTERDNMVYLWEEGKPIHRFDLFGKYLGTETFTMPEPFQIWNDVFISKSKQGIHLYNPEFNALDVINFPKDIQEPISINVWKDHLFILDDSGVSVFTFER